MRRNFFAAVIALALCAISTNTFATPSTQIWIPSTDIQAFLKPHIGWDAYIGAYTPGTISNGGITIGVLPFSKVGMEIGVDYRDLSGNHLTPMYYNAKIGTPEDAFFKYMPAVAIGGYDFGTVKDATTYNLVYGLVAKTFPIVGRISVGGFKGGVGADPKKVFYVGSDPTKVDDAGLLLSWDRCLTEISDKLWAAIDYQGGKSSYGALSFGASYAITPDASFILGYDIFNDDKFSKPAVTFQVDMNVPAIPDWFKAPEKK